MLFWFKSNEPFKYYPTLKEIKSHHLINMDIGYETGFLVLMKWIRSPTARRGGQNVNCVNDIHFIKDTANL